jgi:hypothetical protein
MTAVIVTGMISIDGGPPRPCVMRGDAQTLGFWGGTPPTYPDIGLPPPPLGTWGGRPPNYVDIGGPGPQPHPEHPIVIVPPGAIDGVHPEHPIYLPVYPTHPWVPPPETPAEPGFQWVYTDQYGWVLDPLGGGKPRPPGGGNPSP